MQKEGFYTKTVTLPRPMTGAEIKIALEKSSGEDFRDRGSAWIDDKKCLQFGAQPSEYPYGVAVFADKEGTLLAEEGTYTEIVVKNHKGGCFFVLVSDEKVVEYCREIIKNFLASLV